MACNGEKVIEDSHVRQEAIDNSSSDGDKKLEKYAALKACILSDDSNEPDMEGCFNTCGTYDKIPVTLHMIQHVEHYVNHLKIQYAKQEKEGSSKTEQVPEEKTIISTEISQYEIPQWRIPTQLKKELVSGSGVWIKSFKLDMFCKEATGITDMVRLLLRELIGKEILKVSCAKGNSVRRAIDSTVLIAIKTYVEQYYNGGRKYEKFIKTVNNYCYSLRTIVDPASVKKTFIGKPLTMQSVDFDFVECD